MSVRTAERLESVPWIYSDSPGILLWTWMTEHFIARITGADVSDQVGGELAAGERAIRSYGWELADLTRTNQGMPRVLIEGMASTFEEADARIREHVGKCYDPRLGYQRYCGALATTFELADGTSIDVASFVGTRCTVTVLAAGGVAQTVQGDFSIDHYKWRLRDGERLLELLPAHVSSIGNRSAAAERASSVVHLESYSGIARIYRDEPRTGCTGLPGFMPGTVDHANAPRCPVHEASLPDDLLR